MQRKRKVFHSQCRSRMYAVTHQILNLNCVLSQMAINGTCEAIPTRPQNSYSISARGLEGFNIRRGFAELKTHSHGATATALRHTRSPQRVRRAQDKFARRHSESSSTRTISAEGSPSSSQIRTAPQRERFDTHDLRRGFAELKTNLHGATARALRHARSPQAKFARRHSESASTRTISAEGSPSSRRVRTAPQRERFDTHDLRRGFAERKTHSRGATARALRHARPPQRVRRARGTFAPRHSESRRSEDTFARRHSESASTRTISAEGSPSSRQVRTAPQRERFDTHDLRKGFTFVLQRLQMSERLRLPRNSQTLFPKMLRLPRIIYISAKHAVPTTKNARQSHRMLRWPWNSAVTHKSEDRRGVTARAQF